MTVPLIDFIHDTKFADLPPEVAAMAGTCILDLAGVACAGSRTALSGIANGFAARHLAAGEASSAARLILDGRRASCAGVAFAGAATIDSFDAHDGHVLTKGHAGAAVLPAALVLQQIGGSGAGRRRAGRRRAGHGRLSENTALPWWKPESPGLATRILTPAAWSMT